MSTASVDNKVYQVVSNIRNLPTPPIVFHQIQKVINDPNVHADQIAGILAEDPAMSVKVLKLTNSAFYGLAREVESVKQAVVIIGMEAIKNLVLSASVLDMFKGKNFDQDFAEKFWRHSLAVGFGARMLARQLRDHGIVDPDTAFSAGLLHDIGKVIMACYLPEEWGKVQEAHATQPNTPAHQVETEQLGYNHAQIGSILAIEWKLPKKISEAIAYHHSPEKSFGDTPIAYVISLANYVAKETFYGPDERHLVGDLNPEVATRLEITPERVDEFCDALREEYVKAETFMQMAGLSQAG